MPKKPPKVTVLMTVYNGLPYLSEAIESVLNQSFRDFEFLIVDDASSDGSVALISSYSDPRIRLIKNAKNVGQNASLNIGLKEALGEIIVRLDQDDACLSGRIQKQVEFLDEHPDVAVVGSWAYSIDEHSTRKTAWKWRVRDFGELAALFLLARCVLLHPAVAYRKAVVRDAGGYDQKYAIASDYALWILLLLGGHRAAVIKEPLAVYRVHGGRQSVTKAQAHRQDIARAHRVLVSALSSDSDPELAASLLRMEPAVWQHHLSKEQLAGLSNSVAQIVDNSAQVFSLAPEEFRSLRRTIYRWLGPGVRIARRLKRAPSIVCYAAFFGLSPLLIPGMVPFLTRAVERVRTLRLWPSRVLARRFQ